MNQVGASGSF